MEQRTIAGNFVNPAALIILRILNAGNPQQPVLQLSFTTLRIMARRAAAARMSCLNFLVTNLGIPQGTAGMICARTSGFMSIPAQGITIAIPRGFTVSDDFVRLAQVAFMTLIQPDPTPMGIPLIPPVRSAGAPIQIAPPMR